MAEETEASEIAAKNIYPVVAVEAGYNLYLADNCEDPELRKSACIAAAHAMCDWGEEKEGLPVLVEALKDKTDKARLYAVIALGRIGEKARPALAQIRAGLKDKDNYVQRVTQATLKQLESR